MTAVGAFREAYLTAGMEGFSTDQAFSLAYDFESVEGRATRYDILWAYYQGNAYRTLHKWAKKMKADYGLYTYIRDIFNPANRICNFHQAHIWGGRLDRNAGDGSETPTALPITECDDNIRNAIALVWQASRFVTTKDILTLYGSVLGDVFIRVVNMPERELVYLDRVHPAWVVDLRENALGEVTHYELSYLRPDPEKNNGEKVTYGEVATLIEPYGPITYQTFRNNSPYAWDGQGWEWTVDYPFIPLVHIQHNDVGLGWGWSELFPKLSTFRELDDQASKLSDQIRKLVDSPWLFSGVRPGKTGGTITIEGLGGENQPSSSEVTREETPIIYAYETGARAQPLVSELDIVGALEHVKELSFEVERSYPELRTALWRGRGQGDVSGRALLMARQEADDKIQQRRVPYDEKLMLAQRMALAIGGDSGYDGFQGFSLEQFQDKGMQHTIDPKRPVFKPHPSEALDWSRQLWTNASLAERAGVSLDIFLRDSDWDPERVQEIIDSDFYKLHLASIASQVVPEQVAEETGDLSGRAAPSGPQDFDVQQRAEVEG